MCVINLPCLVCVSACHMIGVVELIKKKSTLLNSRKTFLDSRVNNVGVKRKELLNI